MFTHAHSFIRRQSWRTKRIPGVRWGLPVLLLVLALTVASNVVASSLPIKQGALGNRVVNRHSGLCLDVVNANTAPGVKVQQAGCHGRSNQSWHLTTALIAEYTSVKADHSGLCLDVVNASMADGAQVQQAGCHGRANQQWLFIPDKQGSYQVVNRHSGKCLDVADASTAPGAKVQQVGCHGGANQRWSWFPMDV